MPRRGKRLCRSPSYDATTTDSECSEPEGDEFAPLETGWFAAVPIQEGDSGPISMSFALVIEAPSDGVPGTGLLVETLAGVRAAGASEEQLERREGLFLTNTHVSLETATKMTPGLEPLLKHLFWETDLGPESSLEVLKMSRQYFDYLEQVRKHGISDAVPECCLALLDVPLHRGSAKTAAEVASLRRLLGRHSPKLASYACDDICVACGARKRCTFVLGGHPLGSDCAEVLRRASPVCRLVARLQRRTQLPYPHDFQRMLEDAGALGQ